MRRSISLGPRLVSLDTPSQRLRYPIQRHASSDFPGQDVGQHVPHRLGPGSPALAAQTALMCFRSRLHQHRQVEHRHRIIENLGLKVLNGRLASGQRRGDLFDGPAPGRSPQDQQPVVVVQVVVLLAGRPILDPVADLGGLVAMIRLSCPRLGDGFLLSAGRYGGFLFNLPQNCRSVSLGDSLHDI